MLGTEFSSKMNRRALRRLGNSVIIPPPFINHTPNRDFATFFGTWAMLGRECNRRAVPGPGKSFIIPPPFINQKRRLPLQKINSKLKYQNPDFGTSEYIRTPCSVGHPGLVAYRIPDQPPEVATMLSRGSAYCRRPPTRDGPTERSPMEEIRSSENPKFRIFDTLAEK